MFSMIVAVTLIAVTTVAMTVFAMLVLRWMLGLDQFLGQVQTTAGTLGDDAAQASQAVLQP
ncbi:MAG TPA: hypothetical protein VIX14_03945 [Terriglobales bacterium]